MKTQKNEQNWRKLNFLKFYKFDSDTKMRESNAMERDELTYKIIGCAMKVHNTLGNGFQEVIYQRCLAIEFSNASLSFGREIETNNFL